MGTFHEVKGKVKEKVGRAINDPDFEAEDQVEKVGGKIQKKISQMEKVLGKYQMGLLLARIGVLYEQRLA